MSVLPLVPALIVLDFDGVLTDNLVYVLDDGREMVRCSRADSLGLARLRAKGVPVIIVSTETSEVVAARALKLKLEAFQGVGDKAAFLKGYLANNSINPKAVVFMGNDLNDLPAMAQVGLAVCPADAHEDVRRICHRVMSADGGRGAVRELCEMIIRTIDESEAAG
jgi:N-acylneuraminate cytidylyltransferase